MVRTLASVVWGFVWVVGGTGGHVKKRDNRTHGAHGAHCNTVEPLAVGG